MKYDPLFRRLRALSACFGPSGCETRVLTLLEEELKDACAVRYDPVGNLLCTLPGNKERFGSFAVVCGVDETGWMITKIDEKGFLRVEPTGSADPACFIGKELLFGNEEVLLPGVGGGKVLHLTSGGERTDAPGFDKLFIDPGTEKKDDLPDSIEPGDFAAYAGDCFSLPGGNLAGKALETRACNAVAAQLLLSLKDKPASDRPDCTVVFAVKEKAGYSGAVTALYSLSPQRAVLLGFEPAGDPAEKDAGKKGAVPGNGPVLPLKDGRALYYDNAFFHRAKTICPEIPRQILDGKVTLSGAKGHLAAQGVPMISLRLACLNPETPLTIVRESDVCALYELLLALACDEPAKESLAEKG